MSFIHFTHGFRSLYGSEATYFWKLCQARRQQLISKENSVTCVVKYENQTSENRREFIREASKIVHEWNVHLAIFSCLLLRTDILQKTVVGCPWLYNVKFPKRRVLTFLRFSGNNVQSRSFS